MQTFICIVFGLYCGTTSLTAIVPMNEPMILPEQEIYLSTLSKCENREASSTLRIMDTNNEYSTGVFQFQDKTFLTYGKKYGLIASTTINAIPLIYDSKLQKNIAHKMLLENGESHWKKCTMGMGKYPTRSIK